MSHPAAPGDEPLKPTTRLTPASLYEDGGRGQEANPFFVLGGWSAACTPLPVMSGVQVERPQPRSGEDDDLDARGTGGTMGTPMNRNGDRRARRWPGWVCGSRA